MKDVAAELVMRSGCLESVRYNVPVPVQSDMHFRFGVGTVDEPKTWGIGLFLGGRQVGRLHGTGTRSDMKAFLAMLPEEEEIEKKLVPVEDQRHPRSMRFRSDSALQNSYFNGTEWMPLTSPAPRVSVVAASTPVDSMVIIHEWGGYTVAILDRGRRIGRYHFLGPKIEAWDFMRRLGPGPFEFELQEVCVTRRVRIEDLPPELKDILGRLQ